MYRTSLYIQFKSAKGFKLGDIEMKEILPLLLLAVIYFTNGLPADSMDMEEKPLKDKWPTIINNYEHRDLYHCIYIYFICSDHIGYWPKNKKACVNYFKTCEKFIPQLKDDGIDEVINGPDDGSDNGDDSGDDGGEDGGDGGDDNDAGDNDDDDDGSGEEEDTSMYDDYADPDAVVPDGPKSCLEILDKEGSAESGVYEIVVGKRKVQAWCDMEVRENGRQKGGWTVVQRRGDFADNRDFFFRKWKDYRKGFGDPEKEYWIGLQALHHLTQVEGNVQLRISMSDFEGNSQNFIVNMFNVSDEASGYAIHYKNYNKRIGNSLPARDTKFSTIDRDNDAWSKNCAKRFSGAWWYSACHNSNLNGLYLRGNHSSFGNGVNWFHWKGYHYSLKDTEMSLRLRP